MPVSALLGGLAYLLALIVGITAGTFAALRQNSRLDYASMAAAMLGISMPNFVLGPALVLLFALTWFCAAAGALGRVQRQPDPAGADAVGGLHGLHRAAHACRACSRCCDPTTSAPRGPKGCPSAQILSRHAMRGGLLPVVSFSGPALALLLTGTVVVERIFALPGLGNYFINANLNRDEPLIIGIVAFISIAVLSSTCSSTSPTRSSIRE